MPRTTHITDADAAEISRTTARLPMPLHLKIKEKAGRERKTLETVVYEIIKEHFGQVGSAVPISEQDPTKSTTSAPYDPVVLQKHQPWFKILSEILESGVEREIVGIQQALMIHGRMSGGDPDGVLQAAGHAVPEIRLAKRTRGSRKTGKLHQGAPRRPKRTTPKTGTPRPGGR